MASTRLEYNNKVILFAGFAPVAYMSNPPALWPTLLKVNEKKLKGFILFIIVFILV